MMENIKFTYKNIVIGGMGLAGSTLCFNIFKNLIDITNNSHTVFLGTNKKHVENNGGDMINLYKSHLYQNIFGSRRYFNIVVIRDLRDCVASMVRKTPKKWKNNVKGAADYNMAYYKTWQNRRYNAYFKYEDYKKDPFSYIKNIITLMEINVDDETIKRIIYDAENIIKSDNIPTRQTGEGWNKHLLIKKHATNSGKIGDYKNKLSEEDIKFINEKYSWFLEKYGYES